MSYAFPAALIACALGLGSPLAAQQRGADSTRSERFFWHGTVPAGLTLEVRGVTGSVTASPASGAEAEVTAVKRGRRAALVRIEVVQNEAGVTLCAVYPNQRGDPCARGYDDHHGHDDIDDDDHDHHGAGNASDVDVTFDVRVPRGVRFVGHTVNGRVEVADLDADVVATTVNGDVRVTTKGVAEGTTVNGDVEVRMGRADWTGSLDLTTVNGTVAVALPGNPDVDVRAATQNGEITSDFPLVVQGRLGPHQVSGRIGRGGRSLRLETVNGRIRIRRIG